MSESQRTLWLSALYEKYFDVLIVRGYQYVKYDAILKNYVEDCVVEAFELAWKKYDDLIVHPSILGWLTKTVYFKLDNIAAKASTGSERIAIHLDASYTQDYLNTSAVEQIETWIEHEYNEEIINNLLELLTQNEQEVFRDYFLFEMPAKDIGKKRNISITAVKATISRIRKKAGDAIKKFSNF